MFQSSVWIFGLEPETTTTSTSTSTVCPERHNNNHMKNTQHIRDTQQTMTTISEEHIRAWREALQPLVCQTLDQLTDQHWDQLRSEQVPKEEAFTLVKRLCVDVIRVMTSLVSEVYLDTVKASLESQGLFQDQDQDQEHEQGSPGSGSQHSLCDAIVSSFVEVNSAEEVGRLVKAEIEDRLSLRLKQVTDQSSKTKKPLVSQRFKARLRTIVAHVVNLLKTCSRCATSTTLEEVSPCEEPVQTPVTPFEREEPPESPGGWVSTATDAVKVVLEEVAQDLSTPGSLDGFSARERDQVQSSLSHEASRTASDIVQAATEEWDLEAKPSSSGPSEPKPKAKSRCCQRAARRIQTFCAQRFARSSIFSFVSELRKKYFGGKSDSESRGSSTSVPALLDAVDWVLEDLIPEESGQGPSEASEQSDLYQTIADNLSGETEEVASRRLNKVVYLHIGPEPQDKLDVQSQVQASVDTFLQRLKKWLHQQAWLEKFRKGAASKALQRVKEVMQKLPQEGATEEPESEEAAASSSHQLTGSPAAVTTATDEVAPADDASPVVDASPADAASPADDASPVVDASPADAALPADAASPADDASPVVDASPADAALPADDVTEPLAETTTSPVWDQAHYKVLVLELVKQITKALPSHVLQHNLELVSELTEKLWAEMEACDVSYKPKTSHVNRIIKAVRKELSQQLGGGRALSMYLLTGEDQAYHNMVDTIKRHMVAPKKKSFCSFFSFWKKK
ncbi:uncharacterized protein V6R79_013663 [Siganus canaliculatus]